MLSVYVVWTSISFVVDRFAPLYPWWQGEWDAADFYWLPYGNDWFIHALLFLTAYARAIRPWTVPAQIAVAAMAVAGLSYWTNLRRG